MWTPLQPRRHTTNPKNETTTDVLHDETGVLESVTGPVTGSMTTFNDDGSPSPDGDRKREELRMQMSDAASALVATITAAFANGPTLRRDAEVAEGTWETRDLIRAMAAVNDAPDAFIERHFDSLPAFTAAGLRHVLPQYLIYSLKLPRETTER